MEFVYELWYIREYNEREDTELHIGTYTSEDVARSAILELQDKPGFRDYPDGFDIVRTKLDQTGWMGGFITNFGSPPRDANAKAFDLPAWISADEAQGGNK